MNTALVEANVASREEGESSGSTRNSLPGRVSVIFLVLMLFVFPLFFGGVHENAFLRFGICAFALAIALVAKQRKPLLVLLPERYPMSCRVIIAFALIAAYCLVQYIALSHIMTSHPVLGSVSALYSRDDFFAACSKIAFFCAAFLVARLWLMEGANRIRLLYMLVIAAGIFAALIGIVHWFYDNGMLFWTFAPDYMGMSDRARWPFINPNHLADYLLLTFFPSVAVFSLKLHDLENTFKELFSRKGARLGEVLSHGRLQRHILRGAFAALFVIIIAIAISATLSRGAWMGACAGLLLWFILAPVAPVPFVLPGGEHDKDYHEQAGLRMRKHRRRRRNGSIQRVIHSIEPFRRYIVPVLLLAAMVFLLQGKGTELIEGRIEYGLLYSKTDMRWQLYDDTLSMIRDHPLLGVGAGNWENNFFRYMSPLLAGINPEYLHSDPLQAIAEFGAAGALLFAAVGLLALFALRQILSGPLSLEMKTRGLGLACGMSAFFVASLVEFPLRIPAISFLLAVVLATYCSIADQRE